MLAEDECSRQKEQLVQRTRGWHVFGMLQEHHKGERGWNRVKEQGQKVSTEGSQQPDYLGPAGLWV